MAVKLWNPEYFGAFSRLNKTAREVNIVGFDSEDDTYGKPLSFAFHDGGRVLKKKSFYTTSAEEAVRFIYDYPVESFFVSHNLEYDLGNLFKWCDFLYVDEIVKAPLMLKVTLLGSKHVLINSLSYFKGSLKQMGKIVGVEKLEGKEKTQLNPAYVIRDAEIPYIYVKGFQERLVNDFGIPLSLSIGSIAMQVYRTRFMSYNEQQTYNNPLLVDEAYYGGRVEVFRRGVTEGPVHVCDINSSYPKVMKNYEYPDTTFLEKSKLKTHRFGVGKFRVSVPTSVYVPTLAYKSPSGRLFFPTGEFTGYWTYAEVRRAVEQGATVLEEMDGVGTNAGLKPFSEFVDFFYKRRQVCKERLKINPNDIEAKFESELLKNIMNNLYGKFCQHKAKTRMSRKPISEAELNETLGSYTERKIGSFWEYVQDDPMPPKTANYLWGIHVTAYARLELLRHMENVVNAGGELLYCDTDSIMFTGAEALKTLPISENLGDLSHESYDLGIFRQAKGYLLCDKDGADFKIKKVACKGVQTTHAYEFIVQGEATAIKPMRFKEALVRVNAKANKGKSLEGIGFNVWRDVPKAMRAIDVKRSGGMGKTFPVDAKDIIMLEENAGMVAEDWSPKLRQYPIAREKQEEFFRGVKVPQGWFKETGLPSEIDSPVYKKFYIRRLDLKAVEPGNDWFSGDIQKSTEVKGKKVLELILCSYFGEVLKTRSIIAYLPFSTLKVLIPNEKQVIGKRIVVSLDEGGDLQIEVFAGSTKIKLIDPEILNKEAQNKLLLDFLARRGKILEGVKKTLDTKILTC